MAKRPASSLAAPNRVPTTATRTAPRGRFAAEATTVPAMRPLGACADAGGVTAASAASSASVSRGIGLLQEWVLARNCCVERHEARRGVERRTLERRSHLMTEVL